MNSFKLSVNYILLIIAFICLGTLFDYQITNSLYGNFHAISQFLAVVGEIPYIFGLVLGFCIISTHKIKYLFIILAVISSYVMYDRMFNYLNFNNLLITITLSILTVILVLVTINKYSMTKFYKAAIYSILFILVTLIITYFMKYLWGRPRYLLVKEDLELFKQWYQISGWAKNNLEMSFPSGHASAAFSTIWITFYLRDKFVVYIVLCWGILVSLSRLFLGKHFLTDVSFAALISFIVYSIFLHYYLKSTN